MVAHKTWYFLGKDMKTYLNNCGIQSMAISNRARHRLERVGYAANRIAETMIHTRVECAIGLMVAAE